MQNMKYSINVNIEWIDYRNIKNIFWSYTRNKNKMIKIMKYSDANLYSYKCFTRDIYNLETLKRKF